MNDLEVRYRRVLRLLPAYYRAQREEEMVDAFHESMADRERPLPSGPSESADTDDRPAIPLTELVSIAGLAIRLRLGGVGSSPRAMAWGDAFRLVALLGLLFQAAAALPGVANFGQSVGALVGVSRPLGGWPEPTMIQAGSQLLYLLWIPAFLTLVLGLRKTAQALTGIVLISVTVQILVSAWTTRVELSVPLIAQFTALVVLPSVAVFVGYHREAPKVTRPLVWLMALAPLAGALILLQLQLMPVTVEYLPPTYLTMLSGSGLFGPLAMAAGIGCAAAYALRPSLRRASWPLALAILNLLVAIGKIGLLIADGAGLMLVLVPLVMAAILALLGRAQLPERQPADTTEPRPVTE